MVFGILIDKEDAENNTFDVIFKVEDFLVNYI